MASTAYETWIKRLRASWSAGVNARALLGAYATVLGDKSIDEGEASLLEEIPSTAQDPASIALALVERGIEAGPAQPLASLQLLAGAAPSLNRLRGRPLGVLVALHFADFPTAVWVQQNGIGYQITGTPSLDDLTNIAAALTGQGTFAAPSWLTRTVLGNNNPFIPAEATGAPENPGGPRPAIPAGTVPWWTFDGGMDANGNQFCSRFAILFPVTSPDPGLGTAANLARIRRVIKAWKPAKASCFGIYVATGPIWDWGALWDDPGLVWDNGTSTFYAGE